MPTERPGCGHGRDLSFIPSAVSGTAEPNLTRDRQSRKEGVKYHDIASVMVEDGEPHTINHCKECYNVRQDEKKEPRARDREASCRLDKDPGGSMKPTQRRAEFAAVDQDLLVPGRRVRQAIETGREEWSKLTTNAEVNRWMMVKLKECCYQAKLDDDQHSSSVQQIMQKSTDVLRRIIVPEGHGTGHTVVRVPPTATDFRLKSTTECRRAPPLVDEDWHAVCQAIIKGRRGSGTGELVLQVRGDEQGSPR